LELAALQRRLDTGNSPPPSVPAPPSQPWAGPAVEPEQLPSRRALPSGLTVGRGLPLNEIDPGYGNDRGRGNDSRHGIDPVDELYATGQVQIIQPTGVAGSRPSDSEVLDSRRSRRSKGGKNSGPKTSSIPTRPGQPATRRQKKEAQGSASGTLFTRVTRNRRAWGGALAIALVLLVPSTSVLSRSSQVADKDLSSGGVAVKAAEEFPSTTAPTSPEGTPGPTATVSAAPSASATAKSKTAKAAPGKKSAAKPKAEHRSVARTGFAGLSDSRSGLGWASGAYVEGTDPVGTAASFGSWRGAGVDVAVIWGSRQSWSDIENPSWQYSVWKAAPYTKVFGVAMVPEGDSGATMAGCANGDYNSHWTTFGQNIKNAGLSTTSVIRLGWEFNGDWYKWQASNPAQFTACWRQIVTTVRQVAPGLVWDWSVIRGNSKALSDPTQAWPGNDYVDIVGVDAYDVWPGASDEANWQQQYAGNGGLKFWLNFAEQHGKKISFPEWGLLTGTQDAGHNAGDNSFYIQKMHSFFESLGSRLAYESYFNSSESKYNSSLTGPVQNPNAAATYKSLFG
jgi:hypothetical protein